MSGFDWPKDNEQLLGQLAKQRDRYEQLVRNMSDLLLLVGADGVVSFCNRQEDLPPGGAAYPLAGERALDYVAEGDRPAVAEAIADVLRGSASLREVQFRIRDGGGEERIFEGRITPVRDDDRVVQLQVLAHDITERHRAAEALRQANDALRKRQEELQRDLDVASRIHASLLPAPLATDRILIDLKHIALLGVGGDYVHIHRADPLRPAVAVFDVSGHGIAPALVANRAHSAIYAIMHQGAPPPEMIQRLNRFIYESFSEQGVYLTLFGMQFDLAGGRACYCGAGHPPALLQKAGTGEVVQLRSAHLPVGVAADAFVGEQISHVTLAPGDRVWLYTDGLVETRRRGGDMLGIQGLTDLVRSFGGASVQPGLAAHCLEKVLAEIESPDDDVTLVVAAIK